MDDAFELAYSAAQRSVGISAWVRFTDAERVRIISEEVCRSGLRRLLCQRPLEVETVH